MEPSTTYQDLEFGLRLGISESIDAIDPPEDPWNSKDDPWKEHPSDIAHPRAFTTGYATGFFSGAALTFLIVDVGSLGIYPYLQHRKREAEKQRRK